MAPLKRKIIRENEEDMKHESSVLKIKRAHIEEESDENSDFGSDDYIDDSDEEDISDDGDDLMEASMSGKHDSDEELASYDAVHGVERPKKEENNYHLYAAPTNDEIQGLKEASELFKSNIFKLQIDELLSEVRIDYNKLQPLETALHKLKTILDNIPDIPEASLSDITKNLAKYNVTIPFPDPKPPSATQYKFAFKRPTSVHVAGSFPLKTIVRTRGNFNVDVVVEMPAALFQEKDHLNYRYFYKRAYYLAVLAKEIQGSKELKVNLEFSALNGDNRRPVLILKSAKDKSDTDFSKLKCIIRVLPAIAANYFPEQRLAPKRNNVRPSGSAQDNSASPPPTPQYNTALLQDASYISHLTFLYRHAKACPSFADACLLAKVWLHQRGLSSSERKSGAGFNGFLWSMLMAYLLQGDGKYSRKLSNGLSSFQLFKGTMDFLATHDFASKPLFMSTHSKYDEFSAEAFTSQFDIVFVDPTGRVNLTGCFSRSTFAELQHEAKLTMEYLNDAKEDHFDDIFLKRADKLSLRYDNLARVRLPIERYTTYTEAAELDYPNRLQHFTRAIPAILKHGLTNRVQIISIQHDPLPPWSISISPPVYTAENTTVYIGMVLNPQQANRLVDQGPTPEDEQASIQFRQLWGEKAELRRFKDGSILESVVWDAKGSEQRSLIVGQMTIYLLHRHFNIMPDQIQYWAGQLNTMIHLSPIVPAQLFNSDITAVGFGFVTSIYEQFVKQMKELTELPIELSSVLPASPALRYASMLLPQPLDVSNITDYPDAARYLYPIEVVLEFEESGRWPDDLVAIQKIKSAFYLKIAERLKTQFGLPSQVVVPDFKNDGSLASNGQQLVRQEIGINSYLDILYPPGFVFRCRIRHDREITLLNRGITDIKSTKSRRQRYIDALSRYEKYLVRAPLHTFHIQSQCHRYPSLSHTIRLAKRWLGSHLLSRHVPEELVELLCVRVYVDPAPFSPPASGFAGFSRWLEMMATWDWRVEPLVIDLYNEGEGLTGAEREEAIENFQRIRAQDEQMHHAAMFVATKFDRESRWWSWDSPSKMVAARITSLSRAACKLMEELVHCKVKDIKRLFSTPLTDYSFIIRLNPSKCTRHYENASPNPKAFTEKKKRFGIQQLKRQKSRAEGTYGDEVLVGFDPTEYYLAELEKLFGDVAIFFHDCHGGDIIGGLWRPSLKQPRKWRVNLGDGLVDFELGSKDELIAADLQTILKQMERIGEGIVKEVEVIDKASLLRKFD
ncbi:uncharacterized protein VTP21DRAFT_7807 [Calcarisporiella thermophila]|uniref:uncharacterized protein n=1 Tax=Calcarisporiella thermophila TaxID=911321 RepID=UPI0037434CAE